MNKMAVVSVSTLCLLTAMVHAEPSDLYTSCATRIVGVICTGPGGAVQCSTGVVTDAGILTAGHSLKGAVHGKVEVIFPERSGKGVIGDAQHYERRRKQCWVVSRSLERDLALLRLYKPEPVESISLAADIPGPGEPVFTIGAGSGQALWHFINGHVRQSYEGRYKVKGVGLTSGRIIETSFSLTPGDSGSPILDSKGSLVGINLAIDARSPQITMGVDVSEIRKFLAEAETAGTADHAKKQDMPVARRR